MHSGNSDQEGSEGVPGKNSYNGCECEIFQEESEIECSGVCSRGSVGQIPDGNPGESDGECGTDNSVEVDEDEIQGDIERESHEEYFHPFLDPSHSGKDLEVDLEKEIEHDEKRGILENNSGHQELLPEEDARKSGTEYEHKHARHYPKYSKVLIKETLNGGYF